MPNLPMQNQAHQNHALTFASAQLHNRPMVDGRKHSVSKSKGKGKAIANPDSGPDSEEDDEYVIKTSHLNGTSHGGKGKGKLIDGFTDDGDENLYS